MFDPNSHYNDLPELPPAQALETRSVLKLCIAARTSLEGLKEAGKRIPNESVLINTIPLLEAQASSEIENIVTTTDRLFRFVEGTANNADPATREALRYGRALREGSEAIRTRPLCTATAVQVCQTIKDTNIDIRTVPGTALANDRSGDIIYTPPVGEDLIRSRLANWEAFLHDHDELDPLVRMAAGHYQFEAIHPFVDGNGRTGRILNILYLVEQGLLDVPVLYLSRYIIEHKSDYYDLLLNVTRDGEWHAWVEFMLAAVDDTARWTRAKIDAIGLLHDQTRAFIQARHSKMYSYELAEALFIQPYVRIGNLVDAGLGHRETVSKYLRELADSGVLEERKEGREKLFLNVRLLALLQSDGNLFRALGENE